MKLQQKYTKYMDIYCNLAFLLETHFVPSAYYDSTTAFFKDAECYKSFGYTL